MPSSAPQTSNPVPRLLLEVPDAAEPPPPLVSARAKQAEEQRALLYRMLGNNPQQQPTSQQQQQPTPQQQPPPPTQQSHAQLFMESAKFPVRTTASHAALHTSHAEQTWAKRPQDGVDVSCDREEDAGLLVWTFALVLSRHCSRSRAACSVISHPGQRAAAAPRPSPRNRRHCTELLADGS